MAIPASARTLPNRRNREMTPRTIERQVGRGMTARLLGRRSRCKQAWQWHWQPLLTAFDDSVPAPPHSAFLRSFPADIRFAKGPRGTAPQRSFPLDVRAGSWKFRARARRGWRGRYDFDREKSRLRRREKRCDDEAAYGFMSQRLTG